MAEVILSQIPATELAEQVAEKIFEKLAAQQQNISKIILTIEELSEEYDIPKGTIYAWTSQRKIPHIKKGKRLYFDREAIEEWLKEAGKPTISTSNLF